MRGTRDAAFVENGGKRWLRVAAGLLWAPNNNEIPAGSNELPAGNNEVPSGTGGNERMA